MRIRITVILLLCSFNFSLYAMHWCSSCFSKIGSCFSGSRTAVSTIDDIPAYCTSLAEKLNEQPFFEGYWRKYDESNYMPNGRDEVTGQTLKALVLTEWIDSSIIHHLSRNAQERLQEQSWHIQGIPYDCSLVTKEGNVLPRCIVLHNPQEPMRCSLPDLQRAFAECIAAVKRGWIFSSEEPDCLDISPPLGEREKWHLLEKESVLLDEDTLLKAIVYKFEIESRVLCVPRFNDLGVVEPVRNNSIRMWIKRGYLEKMLKKLGIA